MSNVKFELDTKGVQKEILQADWMEKYIKSEAEKQSGSDRHIKSFIGFDRAKAISYANTKEHPR